MTTLAMFFPRALDGVANVLHRHERTKAGEWLRLTARQHADHAEQHLVLAALEENAGRYDVAEMHRSHAAVRGLMSYETWLRERAS